MTESPIIASLDFIKEFITQLITLSTAILALSAGFSEAIAKHSSKRSLKFLIASWVGYLLSIFAGIWTMSATIGHIEIGSITLDGHILFPQKLQIVLFFTSTVLMITFGILSVRNSPSNQPLKQKNGRLIQSNNRFGLGGTCKNSTRITFKLLGTETRKMSKVTFSHLVLVLGLGFLSLPDPQ